MTASQKPINVFKFIAFHSKITFVCFGFHNQITQRSIPSIPAIPRGYLPDRTSVFISQIVNNNSGNTTGGEYKIQNRNSARLVSLSVLYLVSLRTKIKLDRLFFVIYKIDISFSLYYHWFLQISSLINIVLAPPLKLSHLHETATIERIYSGD